MRWAKGITQVRWASPGEPIGKSPAAVYRQTGVVILNPAFRHRLTASQWYFILLHEWAHLALQSADERAVDALAFREYAKRGYSLREAVRALTRSFPFTSHEQLDRANIQLARAKAFQASIQPTP